MFLLPGFVVTWYITQTPIPTEYRIEMCNYLFSKQRSDGGWGLHIEADSSVFGTAMNYVSLRLLGTDVDDPRVAKARGRLHEFGGAVMGPHWAKFWLSVLGVCEWEAVNPLPPELWYVLVFMTALLALMINLGCYPITSQLLLGDGGFICGCPSSPCLTYTPRGGRFQ